MAYPIKAIPTLYGEEASRFKKWQTKLSANMILVPSETSKILAIVLCAQYSKGLTYNIAGGSRTG